MENAGYQRLDLLVRRGPFVVCRARRQADGQPVLLKECGPGGDRARLHREFTLLRSLECTAAPRALEFVDGAGGVALVLEDRGLVPLSQRLRGRPLPLDRFFPIATRLCAALAELHRQDVIFGAMSPGSVLVAPDPDHEDLQLLDFGTATRAGDPPPGWILDVAPAYVSPEQTGRTNRAVDHRSDLYSLGVTFYEMLTGGPPFRSDDWLDVIHAHIARTPAPPVGLAPQLPRQLSRMVLRLLAKAAEDRYQSAHGLQHDLERCARAWADHGDVPEFELGAQDVSERFLIPQRLYGRDREVAALVAAFERARGGRTSLALVSGYAGIGKTSVIDQLYRPVVRHHGYFVTGKFDQVVRDIPFGAIIQALRALVWQWLAESDEQLADRRERLRSALGTNGGVLAEVIPDIELVVGRQAPPSPLDPAETQNRFRYVFQQFVGAIARPDAPLVLFLDDLQWADAATLDLLHALLTSADVSHLLVVGASRDRDAGAERPLADALARLERSGAHVEHIALGPLGQHEVEQLLRDTVHGEGGDLEPLARLIVQKTAGNPFFVIQFLQALRQAGHFQFDPVRGVWAFRMEAIAAAGVTDNVVDLMTHRIRGLSPGAQAAVTLAACIGNPFDWPTYLAASRQAPEDAATALAEAVQAGLVQPMSPSLETDGQGARPTTYRFLHDRVQQAAYALIPEERRRPVHLDLGRRLLADCGSEVPGDRIFSIVGHLNLGSALIRERDERRAVARLNLAAARKAKLSAAWTAAAGYLEEGRRLLEDGAWTTGYELAYELHLDAAECEYLAGRFDRAEGHVDALLAHAATPLDRARVHSLRTVLFENLSRYPEAVASARDGLALLGIALPEDDATAEATLEGEIQAIDTLLAGRSIASLVDLPELADPQVRMVLRILTSAWAPAYLSGRQLLTRVISATIVRLSLEHGNAGHSAYGYVTHAITVGPVRRQFEAAYQWGELALAVNERFADLKRRAKIHQQFHAHVKLWRRPFATCLPHAREARRSGLESGDFTYAGYAAVSESWPALLICRELESFVRDYSPALGLLERIRMTDFSAALQVMLNWARALQGRTSDRCSLADGQFDEDAFLRKYRTDAPFFLTFFYTAKLHLSLLAAEYAEAVRLAGLAREVAVEGTIWPVLIDTWGSLARAGRDADGHDDARRAAHEAIAPVQHALQELAANCPENFRGFALLVRSELERLDGQVAEAITTLEEAIAWTQDVQDLQQHALAHEMCARLWVQHGDGQTASRHLDEARRAFASWGALAKVRHLEEAYRHLLPPRLPLGPPVSASDGLAPSSVDLETVLKVARAVAGEIELDGLLTKLMHIALENAGAQRGVFLRERDAELRVEAEAETTPGDIAVRLRRNVPWTDAALAQSVVRYVRRTGHDVVAGHATRDDRFAADEYMSRSAPRSVLCVPVGHQGRPVGVLYLENNLATDAFTPARAEMMRILAAQAAISLENARLYEEMKAEVGRRSQAERSLRDALAELEALKNRLEAENVYLQEEIRTAHHFDEIVGNSPVLLEALHRIERVAPTDSTVLIVGETGSGKELFARAVHSRSPRRQRPLVKVNCGAIAPGLVESELFGHVKGAFTGAVDRRVGRFELAHGGTILLDEIGELPLDAQVKLLRVLQEHEFEPVGSSRTVRVDVRVIAATNRDLDRAVRDGSFRADLLYRLNVFPVWIPPLRERRSDIPLLVNLFVSTLSRRLGRPIQGFSGRSMHRLVEYGWPGNVRELQNVIERAAILARGPVLELERTFGATAAAPDEPPPARPGDTLDSIQRAHILAVLQSTGGVVEGAKGAASVLGLHPNTLRSRMKKLGISASSRRYGQPS